MLQRQQRHVLVLRRSEGTRPFFLKRLVYSPTSANLHQLLRGPHRVLRVAEAADLHSGYLDRNTVDVVVDVAALTRNQPDAPVAELHGLWHEVGKSQKTMIDACAVPLLSGGSCDY